MDFDFEASEQDEKTTTWDNWYEGLKEAPYTMTVTKANFNDDKQVFYLFNETDEGNTGISVFCTNHPSSQYKSMPHGVRLAKAVVRTLKCEANSDAIVEALNNADGVELTITSTEKGVLWEVATDA